MIADAQGAIVIAVDIDAAKLALAKAAGATYLVDASNQSDVPAHILEISKGGVHVSIDALGSKVTSYNSISCLRKRGKHIQVGLLAGSEANPPVPLHLVIAKELEIIGSHGMQAHAYPEMMQMILEHKIAPEQLIGRRISLESAAEALMRMDSFEENGMAMITQF
jgi:alcohol dehydrogenase